jgi:hypothetical protein
MKTKFYKSCIFNFLLFLSQVMSPASGEFVKTDKKNKKFKEIQVARKELSFKVGGDIVKKSIR